MSRITTSRRIAACFLLAAAASVFGQDTNAREDLNEEDASRALSMSVGMSPPQLRLDMDKDGDVTSRDATLILQRLHERRPIASSVAVPSILGLDAADAGQRLRAAGLKLRVQPNQAVAPSRNDEMTCARQDPAAGAQVAKGSTVQAFLYGEYVEQTVAVPNVTGRSAREAGAALRDAGLQVGLAASSQKAPSRGAKDTVEHMVPAPGGQAPRGSKVTLYLYGDYEEPTAAVPELMGMNYKDAVPLLEEAGFQVVHVESPQGAPSKEAKGTVEHMDPAPGSRVAHGGAITLFLYGAYVPPKPKRVATVESYSWDFRKDMEGKAFDGMTFHAKFLVDGCMGEQCEARLMLRMEGADGFISSGTPDGQHSASDRTLCLHTRLVPQYDSARWDDVLFQLPYAALPTGKHSYTAVLAVVDSQNNQLALAEMSPTFWVDRPEQPRRSATLDAVNCEHNVQLDDGKGMRLHLHLSVEGCKGENLQARVFFRADGREEFVVSQVPAYRWNDKDATLGILVELTPPFDSTEWKDLKIEVPYDAFPNGNHDYAAVLYVADAQNKALVANEKMYEFKMNDPGAQPNPPHPPQADNPGGVRSPDDGWSGTWKGEMRLSGFNDTPTRVTVLAQKDADGSLSVSLTKDNSGTTYSLKGRAKGDTLVIDATESKDGDVDKYSGTLVRRGDTVSGDVVMSGTTSDGDKWAYTWSVTLTRQK